MSLPALQWRKLPVRTMSSASISDTLNVIYDMLTGSLYHDGSTRTLGSGSAWQMPTKFATGSNTEAVYVFPGFQTSISQSVIFSGRSSTGASSSATPSVVTNETAYAAIPSILHAAVVRNASGSFTQWTSNYPFGSGSYSSGYARVLRSISSGDKLTILESKEAIAIFQTTASLVKGAVMGAIIDPESTASYAAESDGRLYGIATSGVEYTIGAQALSTTFFTDTSGAAGSLFNHSTTANAASLAYPRFVTFSPGSTSLNTIEMDRFSSTNSVGSVTTLYSSTLTTISGKVVKIPIRCSSTVTNYFAGRLRDISMIRAFPSNLVVKDASNNILGFTVSNSEVAGGTNHTLLFNYT